MNKCLERVNDRYFWNPGVFSYAMIPRFRPNTRVFFFVVTSVVYGLGWLYLRIHDTHTHTARSCSYSASVQQWYTYKSFDDEWSTVNVLNAWGSISWICWYERFFFKLSGAVPSTMITMMTLLMGPLHMSACTIHTAWARWARTDRNFYDTSYITTFCIQRYDTGIDRYP